MFLASMTADVAAACLRNNYSQSLAISLSERTALADAADLARLMRDLERRRLLDRRLEALPNDTELSARQKGGKPLTRPELAVLLSYSKIALTDDLLASAVPDRPVAADLLAGYFPPRLRSDYGAEIARHRLRREIIATALTNAVINRAGPATPVRLAEESGRGTPEVALAFLAVVRIFDLEPLWHRLEALDGKIGGSLQLDLEREVRRLLVDQMARLLRTGDLSETFDATLGSARQGVEALRAALDTALTPESHAQRVQRTAALTTAGVPSDLSADLAALAILGEAPNIGRLAQETGRDVAAAAATFFGIGAALRLDGLRGKAQALPVTDPYDQMAVADAVGQVGAAQSAFARAALSAGVKAEDWLAANDGRLGSARATLMQIDMEPAISVSRLTVAAALLRGLTQGS
jgi:glutamate dehydrogenase